MTKTILLINKMKTSGRKENTRIDLKYKYRNKRAHKKRKKWNNKQYITRLKLSKFNSTVL